LTDSRTIAGALRNILTIITRVYVNTLLWTETRNEAYMASFFLRDICTLLYEEIYIFRRFIMANYFENGTTLFKYTFKHGKLNVSKGVVDRRDRRTAVYFENSRLSAKVPEKEEIGIYNGFRQCVWMLERDDKFVCSVFIREFERYVREQQETINKTLKNIETLKAES
jgi:hypothetical protein